ncbi:hypothetical protein ASPACDRAFT_43874 [Aspergillus aculeatus ATCC 16872]|uniref:Rhodopsin domain-containing protein n=1 Tax=Aspergillus aculeatus (strain ATCC 16872 / CBS 172.66 / WB 5094) TaxID=690307 RepID=A0A1L9WSR0_ASPA1|nr:uncharacterized protein ASPACDRAFT_43874 [Aspergillus aculeatus ATCC 16872]OJJ99211.1 hypothetical protein ASPACDRAFT_43874 [Aspergillus aculeatus ATCC 16872]
MASFDTDVDFSESRAGVINAVAWIFTGTAIAVVALKLFARGHVAKSLGWDDFFIFFSMGLSIIAAAFVSYAVTLGLGRHTAAVIADHGIDRYVQTAKWQIIAFPFNIGAFSFPNISIAILISHLLDPNPLRTRCLYAMVTMQVVFAMVSVFIVFFQCRPTQKLWDAAREGHCWDASVFDDFSYWVSAYTTMTDIVLAVVPIRVFWKLQMRTATKVRVCIMMGLTLLSAVVTIIKATYLHLFTDRTDPLYNVVPLVVWGFIEQNVVIVAACIPTLRPFFRKAFESKGCRSDSLTHSSHPYSGATPKLKPSGAKRLPSESELPLDTIPHDQGNEEADAADLRQGIWRTSQIHVTVQQSGPGAAHAPVDAIR